MKKSIVILAIFILVKPFLPILDYAINYDYIAKELCVNKEKPKMHCNGKCHLMKELAKASDNDKQNPLEKKNNLKPIIELFINNLDGFVFNNYAVSTVERVFVKYSNLYAFLASGLIFHPPIFK